MQDLVIETSGLTRRFAGLTAVDQVSLRVPPGSVYGFVGPNGAGKTTTIRMLLGLVRPNAGEVRLLGQPMDESRRELLGRVGALVESPSVYPNLTGRENLEVTRTLTRAEKGQIERALHIVQLEEAADRLVGGYSTGMKQRLGLALALLNEPELLILDEPTNGLDPAGMIEIRELLCRLPDECGATVFLSSHLLAEVEQVATQIGIIDHGKLRFQGPLEELHATMEEHVVLGVERPGLAKRTLERAGWAVRSNGGDRITVTANGNADAALINDQLVNAGLHVFHLSVQGPTLEDMFLTLTGNVQGGG